MKISPGIVLVIHTAKRGYIPFTLLSTETGEVIKEFNQLIHRNRRTDLIEQFNEFLLLKQENSNLQIIDVCDFFFLLFSCFFPDVNGWVVLAWFFWGEKVTLFFSVGFAQHLH